MSNHGLYGLSFVHQYVLPYVQVVNGFVQIKGIHDKELRCLNTKGKFGMYISKPKMILVLSSSKWVTRIFIRSADISGIFNHCSEWSFLLKSIWASARQNLQNDMCAQRRQISLAIRPVWSVFAVCMKKAWVLTYPMNVQRRLWSDWTDAQADLTLHWAQIKFCWFCRVLAHLSSLKLC